MEHDEFVNFLIEQKNLEIDFEDFDWNDKLEEGFGYSIDTRSFNFVSFQNKKEIEDFDKLSKYPGFFYTMDEIKEIVTDWYNKTGGKNDWRMLSMRNDNKDRSGWDWKYIKIIKVRPNPTRPEKTFFFGHENKYYKLSEVKGLELEGDDIICSHSTGKRFKKDA